MNTLTLKLADIWPGDRLRQVHEGWATVLSLSMAEQGQMTPIEIKATPDKVRSYALVAGAHRLRAAELLGWETVNATVFDGDDLSAKLREIDENLMRHELSALDRATFLAERKAIYEALHPETKHGKHSGLGPRGQFVPTVGGFAKNAAERLGFDERTIKRAIRRHNALHPDVRRQLSGTWLANHAQQLDLLASYTHREQLEAVELLFGAGNQVEKRPKKVGEALDIVRKVVVAPPNKDDQAFTVFLSLWRKGSPALHRRIRAFVSKEKS